MKHIRIGAIAIALLLMHAAFAQEWLETGNFTGSNNSFVGTLDPYHLNFRTNNTLRMRLNRTGNYAIGSFPIVVGDGYLGLSPNNVLWNAPSGGTGPFSRLHLSDGTAPQQASFRDWMKNGTTLTGNGDHSYLGQKYGALDFTDMILHWSDNPGVTLRDRMRFIFTSGYDQLAPSGAQSLEGLEAIRIFPSRYDEAFVGIGDFFAANLANPLVQEPTERLDMVNGRMRIRQLPDDPAAVDSFYVMVVDRTVNTLTNQERGVVKWVPPSIIGGGAGECDWIVDNETTSSPAVSHNVYTALSTDDLCPDRSDLVGIGVPPTTAKLQLLANMVTDGVPGSGIDVEFYVAPAAAARGIDVRVLPDGDPGSDLVGVTASSTNGTNKNEGVFGNAYRDANLAYTLDNIGVHGRSDVTAGQMDRAAGMKGGSVAPSNSDVTYNNGGYFDVTGGRFAYGVQSVATGGAALSHGAHVEAYGDSPEVVGLWANANSTNGSPSTGVLASANGAGTTWAIIALGSGLAFGGTWVPSDESLKTEIAPPGGDQSVSQIDAIQLHHYVYNTSQYPQLHLPAGEYLGVFASELAALYPNLVRDVHVPAVLAEDGTVIHEAVMTKAVNMEALVPHLIAGHQDQSTRISQMEAQIAQIQELLAACCASPTDGQRMHPASSAGQALDNGGLIMGQERNLLIQPNPFSEPPTVRYTLERAGAAQLVANSADGKQLDVLFSGTQEAGEYQLVWDTNRMQPGMYYLTLLLDGEPVVKKAVKVGR